MNRGIFESRDTLSSTVMKLASGSRLGPYVVQAMLGSGGMGEVYRAQDTRLNRAVAIKVLTDTSGELRLRFEREARAVASLNHPHICTLFDTGRCPWPEFRGGIPELRNP